MRIVIYLLLTLFPVRGRDPGGPFSAINPQPIRGAGTTDLPQEYEFSDASIEPDTVYWYFVESISLAGERRRITPIEASKPKPSADLQAD